mmetsp:Transcript_65379/g.156317  ORF Transcript_65379/g.156317 Transcript_65379/m.156317 type:complete len:216 (+) Transcript_65379:827-1474(+)
MMHCKLSTQQASIFWCWWRARRKRAPLVSETITVCSFTESTSPLGTRRTLTREHGAIGRLSPSPQSCGLARSSMYQRLLTFSRLPNSLIQWMQVIRLASSLAEASGLPNRCEPPVLAQTHRQDLCCESRRPPMMTFPRRKMKVQSVLAASSAVVLPMRLAQLCMKRCMRNGIASSLKMLIFFAFRTMREVSLRVALVERRCERVQRFAPGKRALL